MEKPLIKTASSQNHSPKIAAAEMYENLYQEGLECVVFFCSVQYDLPALANALNTQFDNIPVIGCTTAACTSTRLSRAWP